MGVATMTSINPQRAILALLAAVLLAGCGTAPMAMTLQRVSEPLFPFVLPWDDATPGLTDLSGWSERPAGASGFVTIYDGHLHAGGKRLRLLGVNVCFGACFPTHRDSEKVAARMAKFGINAVRFHHMDMFAAPDGIFRRLPESDPLFMRALDAGQLDRLDYFVNQLKHRGIYADLNLHVSRTYPGAPTWEGMPSFHKGVDNFHPRLVELQREYARDLLTHRNPHTGTRYADEPAVALVEINNENALLHEWWSGALDTMPTLYAAELERQWQAWLRPRCRDAAALRQAWGAGEEPAGAELLTNGDFRGDMTGWHVEQHGDAQAAARVAAEGPEGTPSLAIRVSRPGREAWHVQVGHPGLRLDAGKAYTLEFQSRADAPFRIGVNAMQAHDPWRQFWSAEASLTPDWRPFRFIFRVPETDSNARITFSGLGSRAGTYALAHVSLRPGGVVGLQPGESAERPPFFRKRDFGSRTASAQRDWIRFLWEVEERYWTGMARFVKQDLGSGSLVLGTQLGWSPFPIQAKLDVIDGHAYWQHPSFPGRPWDSENWSVGNLSIVRSGARSPLAHLAMQRPLGKPYLVTEYNHSAPNTYGSETFPLIAGVAALQDWDGVFAFAYSHRRDDWNPRRIPSFFDIDAHPTKLASLPAAAAIFRRGDLAPFATRATAAVTGEQIIDRVRLGGPGLSASAFGLLSEAALRSRVVISELAQSAASSPSKTTGGDARFRWDADRGVVTITAPLSRALIGFVTGAEHDLSGVRVAPGPNRQDWAAITLTSIAGDGFNGPGRLLLTATGAAENTGMRWKDASRTSVGRDWGQAPSLVEGISAQVTLPQPAARVRASALDERGQRGPALPVLDTAGEARLEIGPHYRTLWYEVEVR